MILEWTLEEKTLWNMKKVIAAAWRMNGQQLHVYCGKLKKNRERILPGQIGSTFIEKLEWISVSGMDAGTKIWPLLMQDMDCLLNIIRRYRNLDRKAWIAALPKIEAHQNRYFKTELGTAFILDLKAKTGAGIPDKKQGQYETAPIRNGISADCICEKKELETVAAWLMEEAYEQAKKAERKQSFCFLRRIKKAAIPVLACLSASFMAVWLHGQIVRNQGRWELHQMKISVSKEADAFLEKDMDADSIKRTKKAGKQIQEKQTSKTTIKKLPLKKLPIKKLAQYSQMSEQYPQLYGWLQIPDTQINLPVMRTESDRDFYLHHDFSGAESVEGALFVDKESRTYPQDNNTIIYGHNMKNGHMFGTLERYANADFFKTHKEIHFDTLYETGTYEAVAVLKTRILNENEQGFRYYQFFRYENEQEFQECRDFVENHKLFETDQTLQYGDKILMLSTCEYSQSNGRLVVVARK